MQQGGANQEPLIPSQTDGLAVLTKRLVKVSIAAAVFVCFSALVSFFIDSAQMHSIVLILKDLVPSEDGKESLDLAGITIAVQMFPRYVFGAMISLLVPFCGYYGATRLNKHCLGCFTVCNCLHGCCGICAAFWMILWVWFAGTVLPTIETFVADCDPAACMALEGNERIDCLATPLPWYHRNFTDIPHLPSQCPAVFLDCSESKALYKTQNGEDVDQDDLNGLLGSLEPTLKSSARAARMARVGRLGPPVRRLRWEDREDGWGHDGLMSSDVRQDPGFGRPEEFMHRRDGHHHRGKGPKPFDDHDVPTPEEWPIVDKDHCEVLTKVTTVFHKLKKAIPKAIPPFMIMSATHLLLYIPLIILSCVSMCWGNSLYRRVRAGYRQAEDFGSGRAVVETAPPQPPHQPGGPPQYQPQRYPYPVPTAPAAPAGYPALVTPQAYPAMQAPGTVVAPQGPAPQGPPQGPPQGQGAYPVLPAPQ